FDFIVPDDDVLSILSESARRVKGEGGNSAADSESAAESTTSADTDSSDAVLAGSLRAPWKWETLIVESAVIGGDPARWHRRLAGLAREYRLKIQEEFG